jgi:hypothetical protein
MSKKFDELVNETLSLERELRALTPDKPSLRCFIEECLYRGEASYEDVESVKLRLTDVAFGLHSGCGAFVRDLSRQMLALRVSEPPAKERVGSLFFAQKDQACLELGGQPERLLLLWVIAAELAYQQNPDIFGTVENIAAHKARIAELEEKRAELYKRIPTSWDTSDIILGPITSDGAALVSWKRWPECPVGKREVAENLIEHVLNDTWGSNRAAA